MVSIRKTKKKNKKAKIAWIKKMLDNSTCSLSTRELAKSPPPSPEKVLAASWTAIHVLNPEILNEDVYGFSPSNIPPDGIYIAGCDPYKEDTESFSVQITHFDPNGKPTIIKP